MAKKSTKHSTQTTKSYTKRKNRRQLTKNAALKPKYNLKVRQEVIDYDYLDKLNPEEAAWLNKFTEEYVGANLDLDKPRSNLHKSKRMRKDCTDRNNSRNRCQYGLNKVGGRLDNIEKAYDVSDNTSMEDRLNAKIDLELLGFTEEQGYDRRKRRKRSYKFGDPGPSDS